MGLIAVESTGAMSAENTSRFLYPIFHFLTGVDLTRFEVWHHYLRKAGHFVGYATLSFLLFMAWRTTLYSSLLRWRVRWSGIAFFMTVTVASLDEWHQTFLPSRTGTFRDVLLDSFAALVAQILIAAFLLTRHVPTKPKASV